jgi:hypothetical protein
MNLQQKELTVEALKEMAPGTVFLKGEIIDGPMGVNMTNSGRQLRWIARRGQVHDWTIYIHWAESTWEYIGDYGDKPVADNHIKRLVPCDDEALKKFRH